MEDESIEMPETQFLEPGTQIPQNLSFSRYDADQLNYLRDITVDKYHEYLIEFVENSNFTLKTKNSLIILIQSFTEPVDYALTNIRSDRELKRFLNNFRMARKKVKMGVPQRDDSNLLTQILDHVEAYLQIRLSRAKGGFERMEQQSVRQHTSQEALYAQKLIEKESNPIQRIFR